jgi:transposase InsO family protein
MDQKIKLIGDCLKKEYSISELSQAYSVSRKTIYKWLKRYQDGGPEALQEMARTPHSHPATIPAEIVATVIKAKLRHQRWGPKKVIAWLKNGSPEKSWPVASTAGKILKREGLVRSRHKRRHVPPYTAPFQQCNQPNRVWSIDYKGQFRMGDGRLCYPLTISDNFSRYLLQCRGLFHPSYEATQPWLEWTFREYGLPGAIRSDNGEPFASVAVGGLTKLSIWLIKLGIVPERIELGHPEQNGRHERMHRTLKEYAVNPPRGNMGQQQRVFDRFRQEYNYEYPHEAIEMKPPTSCYTPSVRPYPFKLADVEYGNEYEVRRIRTNGDIRWNGGLLYVCAALEGEPIGIKPINERYSEIRFSFHLLGYIDKMTGIICHSLT